MPARIGDFADDPAPADAVEAYERGVEAFADGDYTVALEAFAQAYGIHPAPELNLAIARTYLSMDNPRAAVRSARAYLDRAGPEPRYGPEAVVIIEDARRELRREPAPQPPLRPTWQPLVISGGVLLGLGLSAVAGAAVGITSAMDQSEDELAAALAGTGEPDLDDVTRLNREISDLRVALIASTTVSAAVAAAGLVLLGVGVARRNEQRFALLPNGTGLSLRVRF